MESSKPVYFFGCYRGVQGHTEAGHYWRSSDGSDAHKSGQPFGRYPDGTLCPEGGQAQGYAILHQKNGWTAIGFWDRTGDSRGNSNSNFFVHGTHTFEEMQELIQVAFPELYLRFGGVRLHSQNCPDIQGFHIKRVNDERVEIKLHGNYVTSLSHDSDGWDGIAKGQDIVKTIGKILGISVKEE